MSGPRVRLTPPIPRPRPDCQIQARGHHPHHIQVIRFALPQRQDAPRVVAIDVADQTDERGTVGVYRLALDDGTERIVFDHDPARTRALIAADLGDMVLTGSGVLWFGQYAVSVADIVTLSQRTVCGESPWQRWLTSDDGTVAMPTDGGFLIRGDELAERFGARLPRS